MNNSAQAVKDKLKNISREKNIDFNSVMRFYYQKANIKIILY